MNDRFFYKDEKLATVISANQASTLLHSADLVLAERHTGITPARSALLAVERHNSVLNNGSQQCYTAYGFNFRVIPPSLAGFNGERRDDATRCDLLGNGTRSFNPVLMRFCMPDSWSPFGAGGLNAYAYCESDPINYTDPTGSAKLNMYTDRQNRTPQSQTSVIVSHGSAIGTRPRGSVIQKNPQYVKMLIKGKSSPHQADMTVGNTSTSAQTASSNSVFNPTPSTSANTNSSATDSSYQTQLNRYTKYRQSLTRNRKPTIYTEEQLIQGLTILENSKQTWSDLTTYAKTQNLKHPLFIKNIKNLNSKIRKKDS